MQFENENTEIESEEEIEEQENQEEASNDNEPRKEKKFWQQLKPTRTRKGIKFFLSYNVIIFLISIIILALINLKWDISMIKYSFLVMVASDFLGFITLTVLIAQKYKRLPRNHRMVIENYFNGEPRVMGPGLCLIMPWEKYIKEVTIAENTVNFSPFINVLFKGGTRADIDTSITIQIEDNDEAIFNFVYAKENLDEFILQVVKSELTSLAGATLLQDMQQEGERKPGFLETKEKMSKDLEEIIKTNISIPGTEISRFSVTDITPTENTQNLLDNLIDAEIQAKMTEKFAEGDAKAVEKMATAVSMAVQKLTQEQGITPNAALSAIITQLGFETDARVAEQVKTMISYRQSTNVPMPRMEFNETKNGDDIDV